MTFAYDYYTDIGGRECNEDKAFCGHIDDRYLFVVADGLGGLADGQEAAKLVVETLREDFIKGKGVLDVSESLQCANERIIMAQAIRNSNMKTTAAVVHVGEEEVVFAHVGDSRIYAFGEDGILYQSKDHSAAQLAVDIGEACTDEIRSHEDRNMLTRALGSSKELRIEIRKMRKEAVEAILLCTDGFWEYVFEKEMGQELRESTSVNEWITQMRNYIGARCSGKNDNNTAVAAKRCV